jgi:sortase (surface protein transpeptidase)
VALGFGERQQKHGPSLGYRVDFTTGIEPQEVKVLADSGEAILTLATGHTSHFVGTAPKKFIARAHTIPG